MQTGLRTVVSIPGDQFASEPTKIRSKNVVVTEAEKTQSGSRPADAKASAGRKVRTLQGKVPRVNRGSCGQDPAGTERVTENIHPVNSEKEATGNGEMVV